MIIIYAVLQAHLAAMVATEAAYTECLQSEDRNRVWGGRQEGSKNIIRGISRRNVD